MSVYVAADSFVVSAAQDLFRITPPPGRNLQLLELHITNEASETSEQLPFAIYRATSNGGSSTPAVLSTRDPGDASFDGSAVYALTSIATKDAALDRQAVNVLLGYHFVPQKKSRPVISSPYRLVCRLEAAPDAPLTLSVSATVRVYG